METTNRNHQRRRDITVAICVVSLIICLVCIVVAIRRGDREGATLIFVSAGLTAQTLVRHL